MSPTTLWKLRDIYNVNTTLFHNVVSTLECNVALYVVTTLLAHLFHNVVKITFLYLRCVFAGYIVLLKGVTNDSNFVKYLYSYSGHYTNRFCARYPDLPVLLLSEDP